MRRKGKYTKQVGKVSVARRAYRRYFRWWHRLSKKKKVAVIGIPILLFLILVPLFTYAYFARDIANQERLMNRNNTGIVLKDRHDKTFYTLGRAEHREMTKLADISDYTKKALVAAEDKDFYNHQGFNIFSILRAVLTNLSAGSMNAYGGSTLTQQLAKNTLLSEQRTFMRKYQELAMAIAIEREYSKDQILEMYLNSAFFGENSFGIEDAAKTYFNKPAKDLNLAESSMLIGLLPAPNAYSPISGSIKYAKERQNTVLKRMVNNKYITEDEKKVAIGEELAYAPVNEDKDLVAPHFTEMVLKDLYTRYGQEQVMRSGYQVKTTLDLSLQQQLKDSVAGNMPYINRNGGSNAAGIAIDPKSGGILALVGSADWTNEAWGKVNMATTARQPGSSFKSIYYAKALEDGVITPATILKDERTDFGNWTPRNADGRFRGDVTVRSAISQSLNIPSVKVMQKYSINKSVEGAEELGITSLDNQKDYGLTLSLGSAEVPLQQMTNAYAAFANQGERFDNTVVSQISDKFNKLILTNKGKPHKSISKEGAYLISSILSDNSARSPIFGSSLTVPGHTAAVKTGTTDDAKDAWTIGYTPSLAVGVWVGNNDNAPMSNGGASMAGPIWRNTMKAALADKTDETFVVPSSIVQKPVCIGTGGLSSSAGNGTYDEYFLSSALPTERCEPKPTMIEVCNLDTKQVESIDEKKFDSAHYSKNLDDCKKKQISVCDTTTGTVVTIDEKDYDSSRYSKDTERCSKPDKEITVCDSKTDKEVTIKESKYDESSYYMPPCKTKTEESTPQPIDPVPATP